jgi:hypothetical protein
VAEIISGGRAVQRPPPVLLSSMAKPVIGLWTETSKRLGQFGNRQDN